jgi:hypothetical protein
MANRLSLVFESVTTLSARAQNEAVWPHYGQPVAHHRTLRRLYVRYAKCHIYYQIQPRNIIAIVRLESEAQLPQVAKIHRRGKSFLQNKT